MVDLKQVEYVGHGTLLFMAGDTADSMYFHEVTIPKNNGDWDTIAFIPDGAGARELAAKIAEAIRKESV